MTRILVLYASLGSGHVSAARALCDAFSKIPDLEVHSEDALAHASPIYRGLIVRTYEQLSENMPILYKAYYEGSDVDDLERSLDNNLAWAKLERLFFRELGQLVRNIDPDIVVCVQQIPSRLLQLLESEDQVSMPQYVVVTDAVVHSTWINNGVDKYFLPNEISKRMLMQRGIDADALHISGIPVDLKIAEPKVKAEVRSQHSLPPNQPIITLFGGGLNAKRVRRMVQDLLESPESGLLVVAAGRSDELLEALEDMDDGPHMRLKKVGMIDYVDDLIVASDLVITKAGGLITSEVLARSTPMVIVDPIPGQEEENADVIAAAGAGVQIRLPEMVAPAVRFLLKHPERLKEMQQWANALGRPHAALEITEQIMADAQSRTLSQAS
ncbi:Processive diacylglycerol beta-glucosyltransferase [Acaryochloris thomasi RCC1774]|uniref:Processive diacylglycerol beta-glucosyltransferase n=1 Tax=Acaryochloris thomasi RCC1774 TaxID=1764569 RepID=A0A2W1JAC2_9CYAN|nr:glycosyltransferase [Acaryochloris thomasi]PZD70958.1 Processive diacylglycerol beta-glucosyltransferase [Acaryochloris thomasi RCC1774]